MRTALFHEAASLLAQSDVNSSFIARPCRPTDLR